MFELLTQAILDDREREIARIALQNHAIELNRNDQSTPRRRRFFGGRQRASRASNASFTAGQSASTIE